MGTPSNPGWVTNFVPSAAQWAAAFSAKVDYPAPVNQGGTGGVTALSGEYNLAQRALLFTSPINLQPVTKYFVRTSLGTYSLFLPSLSSLLVGDWIDVADVDFAANISNITVTANGSDQIYLYGTAAGSQVISVAGTKATFVVNNGSWRMLV